MAGMETATESRPQAATPPPAVNVRHLRQVLLWPLRLMPAIVGVPGRPVIHVIGTGATAGYPASLPDRSPT